LWVLALKVDHTLGLVAKPVIPATRKAKVGGLRFEARLGKINGRPYLKNKLQKAKGLGMRLK
jgi:hypothetical protein